MINSIASMEAEAKSRGSLSMEAIVTAFTEPAEQAKVQSMLLGWQPLKAHLLDILSSTRMDEAKATINEVMDINSQFLLLVADRYHKLLKGLLTAGG